LRWKSIVAAAALLLIVGGLSACAALKADPAVDATATRLFDDLRLGRISAVRAQLTPEARAVVSPAQIQAVRAYVPPGVPLKRLAIDWSMLITTSGSQTAEATYELRYPEEGVLYSLRLKRLNNTAPWAVERFDIRRASNAELARTGLSPIGRSPLQWLFLAMTVLSPGLMLFAFVTVIRAPKIKLKWLWAVIAFAGYGKAMMNWNTGQWDFKVLSVQLVGFGLTRHGFLGFYPWMLKFTLPVGAIVALWRVRRARRDMHRPGETSEA
jgi:hypothetical protein